MNVDLPQPESAATPMSTTFSSLPSSIDVAARAARDAERASSAFERVGAKASPPKTSASASTIFIMVLWINYTAVRADECVMYALPS